MLNAVRNPISIATYGLASSAFARHYSQNLGWFLFLALLRCFSSGGSPHIPIWFSIWCMCIHIRIAPFGNLRINSYLLIPAAYHVLHRLLMPRHSPYALLSLTIFELCLILLIFMLIAGFLPDFNFRYCRSFFLICITFAFHYSIFKFHSLQDLSCWWAQVDSNHRPHAYQACALTTWAMRPLCFT